MQPLCVGISTLLLSVLFLWPGTGSGAVPKIYFDPGNTGEVKLTCTSIGWYPEPQVQWRDLQGQSLKPASETRTADRNGLFHVETSVTVNTELKVVSCVIRNPVLNEEKEAHVSLSDAVFPRLWPWIVGFAVPLCLLAASIIFFILFIRTRRKKGSLKKKYGSLKKKYGSLKKKYDQLYAEKNKLYAEKGDLKKMNDDLKKQNDDVKKENDDLMEDNDDLMEENDDLKKENDDLKTRNDYLTKVNELNKARRFAEDIVLDKTTANSWLEVSDDGKSVVFGKKKQDLPDNPERFDVLPDLLGENSFSGGDHYWEVEVSGKKTWTIGLCVESTEQKGSNIPRCPGNGFWTIVRKDDVYQAWDFPTTTLDVPEPPLTVGIFLQYEKGLITFYNLTDLTVLYTFKDTFTESLKPYFSLYSPDKEPGMGLIIPKVSVIDPITLKGT